MVYFFRRCYNRWISPEREFAAQLRELLGFTPANMPMFKLAFSHKSNNNDKENYRGQNNERLEYLGDAVLGTIVAEYLFRKYPMVNEGFLTKMRSKIVKRKSLNTIGSNMGLDTILQERNNTRIARSMLGNAVEALVGAIYIERGYKRTKQFVVRNMLRNYVDVEGLENYDDNYKSQLLEHCQKQGSQVNYKTLKRFKQDKRDRFKVAVLIDGEKIATGEDFNKKSAEQQASRKALRNLGLAKTS
ncbi:MAG: ribonuclease III [Bacteroidota bacterium]